MEERRIIQDLDVISLLLNNKHRMYLLPFCRAPHTVGEAAKDRGIKPNQMAYWVERFLEGDLLVPVEADGQESGRRRGKQYQATAREFILMPGQGYASDELVDQLYGPIWRRLQAAISIDTDRRASHWALRVKLDDDKALVLAETPAESIGTPKTFPVFKDGAVNMWMNARFDPATLAELREELEQLCLRYSTRVVRDNPQVPRSILHLALVQNFTDEW